MKEKGERKDDPLSTSPESLPTSDLSATPESRTFQMSEDSIPERNPPALTDDIAGYRIIRLIGAGGMGIVYEAEQDRPKRRVALKVIRSGRLVDDYHVRLFRREAEALGRLRHPGIATIYEAGQTDEGEHFFVMELVPGIPLSQYLSGTELSFEASRRHLALMKKVCAAIHYAHLRGVIHRDLKPSNIMVLPESHRGEEDDGPQIKILDFGLARLADAEPSVASTPESIGMIQGTPGYMSPEQATGQTHGVDVRSDVYALGAILYETQTGANPLVLSDLAMHEVVRRICEMPPTPPSVHRSWLRGDLETIILKALNKEADRRYQGPMELADDIDRFLTNRPILARPTSAAYQFRKLIERHRLPAALLSTLVVLVVGFGITMSVLFAGQSRERARAEREASTAEQINDVLHGILASANPWQNRTDVKVSEILDNAGVVMTASLQDRPVVRAAVMSVLGNSYFGLGHYEEAEFHLRAALETRRTQLGPEHPKTIESMADLSILLLERRENLSEAEALAHEAFRIRKDLFGPESPEVAASLNDLARILIAAGKPNAAESFFSRSLAIRERCFGAESPEVAESLNNLATSLQTGGKAGEAELVFRRALAIWKRQPGESAMATAFGLTNLAVIVLEQGRDEEAEVLNREALALLKEAKAEAHPLYAQALTGLSVPLQHQGKFVEAALLNEQALQAFRSRFGDRHEYVAIALNNLALTARAQHRYAEAEPFYHQALEILKERLGEEHSITISAEHNVARIYHLQGKLAESEPIYRNVLEVRRRILPEDHPEIAESLLGLGALLVDRLRPDEAEILIRESLRIYGGLEYWQVALVQNTLAVCLARSGHRDEALRLFNESEPVILGPSGVKLWKEEPIARTVEVFSEWGDAERADRYQNALLSGAQSH